MKHFITLVCVSYSLTAYGFHIIQTTKNTLIKTTQSSVQQIKKSSCSVAQGMDLLLYPSLCYILGTYTYDSIMWRKFHGKKVAESAYPSLSNMHHTVARFSTGILLISTIHALLTTDTMNEFIKTNMPQLHRLITHIEQENGLSGHYKRRNCNQHKS